MVMSLFGTYGKFTSRLKPRDIHRQVSLDLIEDVSLTRQQPVSLGLFRSDYMVHQDTETSKSSLQVKQVEFNTIASSFGGLSTHTSALHK